MTKVESARIPKEQKRELEEELLGVLLKFHLSQDGVRFMRTLLTESEVVMLARRLRIARQLLQGRSYRWIAKNLRVGLDTIEKVHHWLDEKFEDYRSVLPPLVKRGPVRLKKRKVFIEPHSFRDLRRRYPAHMLFLNILLGDPRYEWVEEDDD
jgi:uncharacterized protein YerC